MISDIFFIAVLGLGFLIILIFQVWNSKHKVVSDTTEIDELQAGIWKRMIAKIKALVSKKTETKE
jgi:hypothetical protein